MGQGIVEMTHEEDHAYNAGYTESRGTRSWRNRMKILGDAGFIRSNGTSNRPYVHVLVVHPSIAMKRLYDQGKIDENLWKAYRTLQIEIKEPSAEELEQASPTTAAQV